MEFVFFFFFKVTQEPKYTRKVSLTIELMSILQDGFNKQFNDSDSEEAYQDFQVTFTTVYDNNLIMFKRQFKLIGNIETNCETLTL